MTSKPLSKDQVPEHMDEFISYERLHGIPFKVNLSYEGTTFDVSHKLLQQNREFFQAARFCAERALPAVDGLKLTMVGVIYGGLFDHPDVVQLGHEPVSDWYQYSPDVHYAIYEIWYEGFDLEANEQVNERLSPMDTQVVLYDAQLKEPPLVACGGIEECLEVPGMSLVPSFFDLPENPDSFCAGVVAYDVLNRKIDGEHFKVVA